MRRIWITVGTELEAEVIAKCVQQGACGYTAIDCRGSGRTGIESGLPPKRDQVQIELIVPMKVCNSILEVLRREYVEHHAITVCVEHVDVMRAGDFIGAATPTTQQTLLS